MPFPRLNRRPLVAFLFTAALALISPPTGQGAEDTLVIPGGFPAVARVIGLDESLADPASGIERIFTAVLTSDPPGGLSPANRVQSELISYLDQYTQFVQFLQREHMLPRDRSSADSLELVFPFKGKREDLLRTRKLLLFFGIQSRIRQEKTEGEEVIETDEARSVSRRIALYRGLGLHLTHGELDEARLSLETGHLPVDGAGWSRILSEKNPDSLFQRFVENPAAMRLWLALAACPQSTRDALTGSVEPGKLLNYSEALLLFGPDLKIERGTLIFPGSREAWAGLPGSPALSLNALLSDGGTPLLLYSSLSSAPPSVQDYLTASPGRLRSYFEILKPYGSFDFWGSVGTAAGQDLPRILRLLKVDSRGLVLNLQDQIASPLLYWIAPSELAAAAGSVVVTPRVLARLLPRPGVSPYSETSRAGILEFFRYLEETHPELVTADSATALTRSPEEVPVVLDLLGDLSVDARLLSKYLDYCNKIAAQGTENWNLNRTRTSQAIFFLISALYREGAFSPAKARNVLEKALDAFGPEDESSFAFRTAEFLSTQLMPELLRDDCGSRDPLLLALSGNKPPLRVRYEGKELALDLTARKYLRMRDTMQSQSQTPVSVLLQIYAVLHEIRAGGNQANADEKMRLVSKLLDCIRTAEWTPAGSIDRASVAQIDIDSIKRKIASSGSWAGPQAAAATSAEEIAARIHTELGVTLLSYCYAYSARPDIDVLAYDPNFVRKHRFYPSQRPFWRSSRFTQEEELGGLVEGSLAGLGFEMTRLQIAQSSHDFGISSNIDIAPSILYSFRQVRPNSRTERSQEYVALATQLGRSLVLHSIEEPLGQWVNAELNVLLSQQRLEKMQHSFLARDPALASGVLSRSELFLLGEAYFKSKEWESARCPSGTVCATLARLNEIVPKPGSPEYNTLQDEVSQYGMSLRSRIGLSRFSFIMIDPYERLQRNLRPHLLYDRICDLKIRIAELNYALGLPAALGEVEADLAWQSILPQSPEGTSGDWKYTIGQINSLSEKAVLGWVHELIARGSLNKGLVETGKAPEL